MSRTSLCAGLIAAFSILSIIAPTRAQGLFPCHNNKQAQGSQVTCSGVILPQDLCSSCKLKTFNTITGAFFNCRSIYNLGDGQCQASLIRYADLNSCDPVRNAQVKDFNNPNNREGLDYFIYSVCEQCCDCVPHGATPGDFDYLKNQSRLLRARRGNCPAHAWYDVCTVLPKVRYFKGEDGPDYLGFEEACPQLKYWFENESDGWLQKGWVPMSDGVQNFLENMYSAASCTNKETWQRCTALEDAQNRL